MGVSKVILNGDTLIDVTGVSVASSNLVSPNTALGADGESVTGSIATKTSSDITVTSTDVTIPAGYYASQVVIPVSGGGGGAETWYFTAPLVNWYAGAYSIDFVSNGVSYTQLLISSVGGRPAQLYMKYNNTTVCTMFADASSETWNNDAYRTITITGGTDANNTSFRNWLSASATQMV